MAGGERTVRMDKANIIQAPPHDGGQGMTFRIYFKDKGRAVDVDGDTLSYSSSTMTVQVDKSGKCVAIANINEIIAVKALLKAVS